MSERDQLLSVMAREHPTTLKLLKAYPTAKGDLRPHERSKTAKDLAWTFVTEGVAGQSAIDGAIDFSKPMPQAPGTMGEVISSYEAAHQALVEKIRKTPEAELNKPITIPVGPKQMGETRRMDFLWMMLMDSIHHRGQLSVYLRLAGAKVPSIYGPSADEPWM